MTEQNRYRITGSIFLIALAVIFLPMIFDGEGTPTSSIPALPDRQLNSETIPNYEDVVPDTDVVERVDALRNEVDADGFTRETGTRFGEPVLTPVQESTEVWAVQAASFASFDNAAKFRSQLRQGEFEAFISTVKETGGDVMYRVAVGPYLSREDVNSAATRIGEDFNVQPQVVAFSQ